MKTILKFGIRFILYIMIVFPIFRGVFSGLGGILSFILAFFVTIILISILEVRGLTKKLVNFVSNLVGVKLKSSSGAIASTLGDAISPEESIVECPNCGSQVTLKNGRGNCSCCDTALTAK